MSLIAFHSPKGGVGVTSCVANVAAILARLGLTVTAVDMSGLDEMKVLLGAAPEQPVIGAGRTNASMQIHHGVRIAAAPPSLESAEERVAFLTAVSNMSEVVIADLSGLDTDSRQQICERAVLNICVLSGDAGSIIALPRAIDVLATTPRVHFVINKVDKRGRVCADALALFDATLGSAILAKIRRDEAVNEAAASMEPLAIFSPASAAARDLTALGAAINASLPALLSHVPEVADQ